MLAPRAIGDAASVFCSTSSSTIRRMTLETDHSEEILSPPRGSAPGEPLRWREALSSLSATISRPSPSSEAGTSSRSSISDSARAFSRAFYGCRQALSACRSAIAGAAASSRRSCRIRRNSACSFMDAWVHSPSSGGWESRGNLRGIDPTFALTAADSERLSASSEIYVRVTETIDVNATWSRAIGGRNTAAGDEYGVGFAVNLK